MEFTKVVAERYSCKNFSTRKVEAEKLTEILEAGRLAPTAKNSQEQRIYVLQSDISVIIIETLDFTLYTIAYSPSFKKEDRYDI